MSHYFETPATAGPTRDIRAEIWGRDHIFRTAPGVFSMTRLDPGTAVLLRTCEPLPDSKRLLDLGCGYGPITVALATELPDAQVDAVDVNELALELTTTNAGLAQVADRVHATTPDDLTPPPTGYDEIWSNPPIRVGKAALHDLLLRWLPHLSPTGRAVLVVGRNLGADSLQTWLTYQGWPTTRLASAKGFRVLEVVRP